MKPITLKEKDLIIATLARYKEATPELRARVKAVAIETANGHPDSDARKMAATLLPLLYEADMERKMQPNAKPEPPTRAETVEFFGNIGAGLSVLTFKVGVAVAGCWLLQQTVVWVGNAIAWAIWESRVAIGVVAGLLVFGGLALALPKAKRGGEDVGVNDEQRGGNITINQTVIFTQDKK